MDKKKGLPMVRQYFEAGEHGRKMHMKELRELAPSERQELVEGVAQVLKAKKLDTGEYEYDEALLAS